MIQNHVVDCQGDDVHGWLFDFIVGHGDERPNQRLDICVMLHKQQRPPLQEGERNVDQVNGRQDQVGDNPLFVRWQHLGIILLGVINQLTPNYL